MIHPLDLGEPDGCSEVHHAVVIADHIEPIALVRTDPLPTVESDLVGENVIISRDHSSFTGSYDLIAVKGKGRASSRSRNRPGHPDLRAVPVTTLTPPVRHRRRRSPIGV